MIPADLPPEPLKRFEIARPAPPVNSWEPHDEADSELCNYLGYSSSSVSMAFKATDFEAIRRLCSSITSSTTSSDQTKSQFSNMWQASARASAVQSVNASANLYELKRLTDYNWEEIADLLAVDRRSVHNWIKGAPVRDKNKMRIRDVLAALRYIDRGDATANRELLTQQLSNQKSGIENIRDGEFWRIDAELQPGPSRPQYRYKTDRSETESGFGKSILMHDSADGSEIAEPAAMEPPATSRKRKLKRK